MAFKAATIRAGKGSAGVLGILRVLGVLGAFSAVLLNVSVARADAIRRDVDDDDRPRDRPARPFSHREIVHPARIQIARGAYWTDWAAKHGNYFDWALQTRDARAAVPRQVQLQAFQGVLPQTPVVQYLEWRRGLNPVRFDRYHPWWASQLATDEAIRTAGLPNPLPIVATIPASPPNPITPTGFPVAAEPQRLTVPEPASGAILLGLLGASAVASHWKFKRIIVKSSIHNSL